MKHVNTVLLGATALRFAGLAVSIFRVVVFGIRKSWTDGCGMMLQQKVWSIDLLK
jgi:hypothetical protein